jgi:hypothetical protein
MAGMKPLQSVAMGLVIIVLVAPFDGYDALPDAVGWLLACLGVRALPADLPHRRSLLGLAALAGVVAAVVWFPAVAEGLDDADASLGWAVSLPQLLFSTLLCQVLAGRAAGAGDVKAARWLAVARTAVLVVALLPVLVFGAHLQSLTLTSELAAGVVALLLIWLLFAHASRPWTSPIGETSARFPSAS